MRARSLSAVRLHTYLGFLPCLALPCLDSLDTLRTPGSGKKICVRSHISRARVSALYNYRHLQARAIGQFLLSKKSQCRVQKVTPSCLWPQQKASKSNHQTPPQPRSRSLQNPRRLDIPNQVMSKPTFNKINLALELVHRHCLDVLPQSLPSNIFGSLLGFLGCAFVNGIGKGSRAALGRL